MLYAFQPLQQQASAVGLPVPAALADAAARFDASAAGSMREATGVLRQGSQQGSLCDAEDCASSTCSGNHSASRRRSARSIAKTALVRMKQYSSLQLWRSGLL